MNILKRELRTGLKPFLFWTLGLFILVFVGIMKFEGISSAGGASMSDLLAQFPRVVLAVLGMVGIDVNTLGGYNAILAYYVLICAVIYAVHLGSSAVSRESVDKTYEFLFTKPRSRSYILQMKLFAVWIYLSLFCVLNYIFSVSAIATLKLSENLSFEVLLFSVTIFLVSSMFLALSAFISAVTKQAEKGAFYGNLCFLYAFILGIIYDMLENGGILKFISPFKYFSPADLLVKKLDPLFVIICVALIVGFLYGTFARFQKKDLNAV